MKFYFPSMHISSHQVDIQDADLLSTSAWKIKRKFEHVYEAQNTSEEKIS
jgi:hypothetical protein